MLRQNAEFWAQDARQSVCCLFASDEDITGDPQAYNCETCLVADALYAINLDARNKRAWQVYHQVACRFHADTHTVGLVLERLVRELDDTEFFDCMARLRVLYDALDPPVTSQG